MVELSSSEDAFLSRSKPTQASELSLCVIADNQTALERLKTTPHTWVHSPYQDPSLLVSWLTEGNARAFLVEFQTSDGPVILPLQSYDDCTAGYIGGRHANGNFPIGSPDAIRALGTVNRTSLKRSLHSQPMAPCSLTLERQLRSVGLLQNPFVDGRSTASPNVALSLDISDGFDAVLAQRNAKRMRKKARSSMRKLEELGHTEIVIPDQSDLASQFLDRFFELKSQRFNELGIFDVFADAATRAVFRKHFAQKRDTMHGTRRRIHALCLEGNPIAIIGCTEFSSQVTVEFGAFDNSYAHASPGDLLFFKAIEHYCTEGYTKFDFGIGDETYKRRWCDIETWHADTFVASNLRGQLIAITKDARTNAVRALKTNQRLWSVAKQVRKRVAGLRSQ
ncbi:MAG: GNAT family N-acetyltransferase [Pseudomonadota bacterium]